MTWYDLDLGDEGVKELDKLFSEHPYKLGENEDVGKTVSILVGEKEEMMMSYWKDRISIYNVFLLSNKIKEDMRNRLSTIKDKLDSRSLQTLETILKTYNWNLEELEKIWGRKLSS